MLQMECAVAPVEERQSASPFFGVTSGEAEQDIIVESVERRDGIALRG